MGCNSSKQINENVPSPFPSPVKLTSSTSATPIIKKTDDAMASPGILVGQEPISPESPSTPTNGTWRVVEENFEKEDTIVTPKEILLEEAKEIAPIVEELATPAFEKGIEVAPEAEEAHVVEGTSIELPAFEVCLEETVEEAEAEAEAEAPVVEGTSTDLPAFEVCLEETVEEEEAEAEAEPPVVEGTSTDLPAFEVCLEETVEEAEVEAPVVEGTSTELPSFEVCLEETVEEASSTEEAHMEGVELTEVSEVDDTEVATEETEVETVPAVVIAAEPVVEGEDAAINRVVSQDTADVQNCLTTMVEILDDVLTTVVEEVPGEENNAALSNVPAPVPTPVPAPAPKLTVSTSRLGGLKKAPSTQPKSSIPKPSPGPAIRGRVSKAPATTATTTGSSRVGGVPSSSARRPSVTDSKTTVTRSPVVSGVSRARTTATAGTATNKPSVAGTKSTTVITPPKKAAVPSSSAHGALASKTTASSTAKTPVTATSTSARKVTKIPSLKTPSKAPPSLPLAVKR